MRGHDARDVGGRRRAGKLDRQLLERLDLADRRASRLRLTRAPLLAEAEEAGNTRDDDGDRKGDATSGPSRRCRRR